MQLQLTPEQEQKLHDFSARAQGMAKEARVRAEKLVSEIHPQEMVRDAGQLIKKRPMESLAVGAVVGGLLGALLARRGRRA